TGLLDVFAFDFDGLADRLAVGHLRLADVGFHTELATHAVDENVEVQLAHARDDGLTAFLVGVDAERGIFLGQLAQRDAHLLLVDLGFRLHGHGDHRLGEVHLLQGDLVVEVAQRLTSGHVFQTHHGGNVTGQYFLDFFAGVGVHLYHAADTFLAVLQRVVHGVAGAERARVHPNEGEGANEGVGGDFERQRREGLVVVGLTRSGSTVFQQTFNGLHLSGRRQVFDDRVEHRLHTLVLEGRTADGRHDFVGQGTDTQTRLDLGLTQLTTFEVLVHQFLIGFGSGLDQVFTPLFGFVEQVSRDLGVFKADTLIFFIPDDTLHLDQVDDAPEGFFGPDRQLDRHGRRVEAVLDLLHDAQEVGTGAIHLV